MTNTRISTCCGASEQSDAPFNADGGFCKECREHCGYIDAFEDEAGDPTPLYVWRNGMLHDRPERYAEPGGRPTLGEIAVTALIVVALFTVAMAAQILGY